MQTKREQFQQELTLLPPLETLIPEDHPLRRLNRVLDLGFVHEVVRERYCQENGRPSVDPEVIIRLFLIQALSGLAHVRELMREVQVNLAYRWFIGYRHRWATRTANCRWSNNPCPPQKNRPTPAGQDGN